LHTKRFPQQGSATNLKKTSKLDLAKSIENHGYTRNLSPWIYSSPQAYHESTLHIIWCRLNTKTDTRKCGGQSCKLPVFATMFYALCLCFLWVFWSRCQLFSLVCLLFVVKRKHRDVQTRGSFFRSKFWFPTTLANIVLRTGVPVLV